VPTPAASAPSSALRTPRSAAVPNPQSAIHNPQSPTLRFRLNPGSPVVDAPTIGSRTAGKLERAGVITVGDLLDADPEALAKRLNQKHFTPDVIRHWQQESSLNCRVPELYNHDAQILVASGITDPNELAACEPQELLELVTPWCKSPEGQRILRQQKPPDLAEVTQWIEWAKSARRLKAA
jgi:nucleotidyltransferase/DNA polymerase involved in DNA repair